MSKCSISVAQSRHTTSTLYNAEQAFVDDSIIIIITVIITISSDRGPLGLGSRHSKVFIRFEVKEHINYLTVKHDDVKILG